MLGFKDRKREIFCFYIEIKRPGKDSKYQEEDDFVKLMELMKFSFNRQITLGIKNPLAFGLLCQGFTSSLYKMTLKEDGIYMPIMVKRFSLVGDKSELMNVPLIVEAFGMVKEEMDLFQKKEQERRWAAVELHETIFRNKVQ